MLCLLLNKIIEGAIPSLVSAKERNVGLEIKLLFAKNSLIEHYSSLIILLKILQIFFDNNFTENLFLFTLLQIERDKRRKWYDCWNTWKWATWSFPLPLFLQINTQIFCILKNCRTYFFSISSLLFGIHVIIFYFQPLLILSRGGSRPWAKRGVRRVVVVCRLLCQFFFPSAIFFNPK